MDSVLQNLPGLIGVFRIYHDPVFKRLYLEIPLLLIAHFLLFPFLFLGSKNPNPKPGSKQPKQERRLSKDRKSFDHNLQASRCIKFKESLGFQVEIR
jgi:hypothetical protein